jgi:uncharacterized membrane protein YphA (DoxX/SURF4 family)
VNWLVQSFTSYADEAAERWNRFWFRPQQPYTLALIRICGGAMLFYTHLVYSLDLAALLGPASLVSPQTSILLNQDPDGRMFVWSYLWSVESPALLWTLHLGALVVFALLTVGLFTRVVSVLAFLITLSYCHRLIGSQFGLDQVNAMLAMYLMIGPAGAAWSVDRWLAVRNSGDDRSAAPSPWTTVAIRLIQLHMCIIYLFGGIGKMRGEMWWDGSAVWYALSNLEYQSVDATWLVHYPWFIALLTHITVFWETFYCFFVWPKLTRPICLGLAVAVHGGIAIFLGMKTFGLAMIIGNAAFVYPETVKAFVDAMLRWVPRVSMKQSETRESAPKKRVTSSVRAAQSLREPAIHL